jgi:hypothetical protein
MATGVTRQRFFKTLFCKMQVKLKVCLKSFLSIIFQIYLSDFQVMFDVVWSRGCCPAKIISLVLFLLPSLCIVVF